MIASHGNSVDEKASKRGRRFSATAPFLCLDIPDFQASVSLVGLMIACTLKVSSRLEVVPFAPKLAPVCCDVHVTTVAA